MNPSKKEENPPLQRGYESVLDVPIDALTVDDICRAIRQKICIDQLMPRALALMKEDPLVGENYGGELIAALATINGEELSEHKDIFIEIMHILNNLDTSKMSNNVKIDILKLNQIII